MKRSISLGLLTAALIGSVSSVSAQTVPPKFSYKQVATGLQQPKGLDAAHYHAGVGPMGRNLFVAESGLDRITEVNKLTGAWAPMASSSTFPVGVACYGGPFGMYMYVGNAMSGGVTKVAEDGTVTPFALAGMSVAGLDFGKGVFGEYLYAGEWVAGDIWRIDAAGNATLFASLPAGSQSRYLAISHGGEFGTYIYVSDYMTGNVYRVDPVGNVSFFTNVTSAYGLEGLTFGPGGAFGKDLFLGSLSTGEIFKVSADGTTVVWGSGFPGVADILFVPGGKGGFTMYFVDGQSNGSVVGVA